MPVPVSALCRGLPRRHLPAHPGRAIWRQGHSRDRRCPPVRVHHAHRTVVRPRPRPARKERPGPNSRRMARCPAGMTWWRRGDSSPVPTGDRPLPWRGRNHARSGQDPRCTGYCQYWSAMIAAGSSPKLALAALSMPSLALRSSWRFSSKTLNSVSEAAASLARPTSTS